MIRGTLFILSAPSGGGKTSLVNALLRQLPHLEMSISHTTRLPRGEEKEGEHYFFIDEPRFKAYQAQGLFLESAKVFNHWYGTSKAAVLQQLEAGKDVLLDIDWQGARSVKAEMPCVSIFILPPSREVLLARLQNRKRDSEQMITERMNQASDEMSHYTEYDFLIINNDFETAVADLVAIVKTERLKTAQQKQRVAPLIHSLLSSS